MNELLFHPRVVHFPIALATIMPLVAGGLALAWWRKWLPARAWIIACALQFLLCGFAFAAVRTGHAQHEAVEHVVPHEYVETHEAAGEWLARSTWVVLALMVAAAALSKKRYGLPIAGVAVLSTLWMSAIAFRVGQTGGSLVYEHGAASAYVSGGEGSTEATTDDHDEDTE